MAELTLGQGLTVSHGTVELLMRTAGLQGLSGRRKWRRTVPDSIATDLVGRQFGRNQPNSLWVTDIERHEALLNRVEVGDLHR
jgi:putative transposase